MALKQKKHIYIYMFIYTCIYIYIYLFIYLFIYLLNPNPVLNPKSLNPVLTKAARSAEESAFAMGLFAPIFPADDLTSYPLWAVLYVN